MAGPSRSCSRCRLLERYRGATRGIPGGGERLADSVRSGISGLGSPAAVRIMAERRSHRRLPANYDQRAVPSPGELAAIGPGLRPRGATPRGRLCCGGGGDAGGLTRLLRRVSSTGFIGCGFADNPEHDRRRRSRLGCGVHHTFRVEADSGRGAAPGSLRGCLDASASRSREARPDP